jgi:integrase
VAKKKAREHRHTGGSVIRVKGRPGLFGQFRMDGKRYQCRLMQDDGETPIAENDAKGAEHALVAWILKLRAKGPDADGIRHATLTEFLVTFYPLAKSRVGERHIDALTSRLDTAAKHFGATDMSRIDRAAAETYLSKLSREDGRLEKIDLFNDDGTPQLDERGKQKTKTIAHPMTAATLKVHRSALSACWTAAVDRGFAPLNPWRQVRVAKGQEFVARLLTHAEVRSIVIHTPPQVRALVEFLSESGLRLGEAQALTWQRVAPKFGQIVVARSKSGRSRTVPMTERARAILQELWDNHIAKTTGPDLVFAARERSYVWHLFQRACIAAGLGRGVRIHDLRHYVGTSLAQAGVPIPTIMGILGHSQIQTTQRYAAHLPANAATLAFAALDAARGVTPAAPAATAATG